jgi:Rhodopirellula transposase DDE domain
MPDALLVKTIQKEFLSLGAELDDRGRRDWAFKRAMDLGRSGMSAVHEATGIALSTLRHGIKNVKSGNTLSEGRQRRPGAGRRAAVEHDPRLLLTLYKLMEPRGFDNRQAPLRWTTKSTRQLASELAGKNHPIGATTVLQLLKREGFHTEANQRTRIGQSNPERDAQYHHILRHLKFYLKSGLPAVVVEAFVPRDRNSVIRSPSDEGQPSGYTAWMHAGIDREALALVAVALHDWWLSAGRPRHRSASRLLVVMDSSVSMWDLGWKAVVQRISDALRLEIELALMPPAIHKWTATECQLIYHLSRGLRGDSPITHKLTVSVIGSAVKQSTSPTESTLELEQVELLARVTMAERSSVNLQPERLHPAWNYTIRPKRRRSKWSDYFRSTTYARQ